MDNALSDVTSRETGINISQMNLEKLRSNFETDVCLTVEEKVEVCEVSVRECMSKCLYVCNRISI